SQNNFHIVRTNSDRQFYRLYSPSGSPIVDRSLLANTDWRSDQVQTINNEQFYRVSTFEWVRAVDVTVIK
ncbi:MAG: hypothetical protein M3Z87_10150, partial [Lactobacillus sp.]|nr:hypothetical protein [Lactobacillus sp.]